MVSFRAKFLILSLFWFVFSAVPAVEGIEPPRETPKGKITVNEDSIASLRDFKPLIKSSFERFLRREKRFANKRMWLNVSNKDFFGGGAINTNLTRWYLSNGMDKRSSTLYYIDLEGEFRREKFGVRTAFFDLVARYRKRHYLSWAPRLVSGAVEGGMIFPWRSGVFSINGYGAFALRDWYPVWGDDDATMIGRQSEPSGRISARVHQRIKGDFGLVFSGGYAGCGFGEESDDENVYNAAIGGFKILRFGILRAGVQHVGNSYDEKITRPFLEFEYATPILGISAKYGADASVAPLAKVTIDEPTVSVKPGVHEMAESLSISIKSRFKTTMIKFNGVAGKADKRAFVEKDTSWGFTADCDRINILYGSFTLESELKKAEVDIRIALKSMADYSSFSRGGWVPLKPRTKTTAKVLVVPLEWFSAKLGVTYCSGMFLRRGGKWVDGFWDISLGFTVKWKFINATVNLDNVLGAREYYPPYFVYSGPIYGIKLILSD